MTGSTNPTIYQGAKLIAGEPMVLLSDRLAVSGGWLPVLESATGKRLRESMIPTIQASRMQGSNDSYEALQTSWLAPSRWKVRRPWSPLTSLKNPLTTPLNSAQETACLKKAGSMRRTRWIHVGRPTPERQRRSAGTRTAAESPEPPESPGNAGLYALKS